MIKPLKTRGKNRKKNPRKPKCVESNERALKMQNERHLNAIQVKRQEQR